MRVDAGQKKRKKEAYNPGEGWEDGTPPPHRDFKERRVWLGKTALGALGVLGVHSYQPHDPWCGRFFSRYPRRDMAGYGGIPGDTGRYQEKHVDMMRYGAPTMCSRQRP